jgi:ADP-ribose pyrophosphatase YjhB (NUDIX family)
VIQLAAIARRIVWFVFRPRTIGALMMVVDSEDRVLLVEHSYEQGVWRLPGGGAKRGELLSACAARELREETGVRVDDVEQLELLGVYSGRLGSQSTVLGVYLAPPGSWEGEPGPSAEIDRLEFHDPASPPPGTSPATRRRLQEFATGRRGVTARWTEG